MTKINILTQSVYNRIAAGEVVDRPYSAVKEIIENSLDAGADEIEIYIENGGKQLIKIIDNGSGIERDDLKSAFLPHATSKIAKVEDLDSIATLGFRGEALASISSVAKVEIISVTKGNSAYKISCDGGKIGEVTPAALEKGTIVKVNNLFYNTPVRAKFLKDGKKEEADISSFIVRYILCNPAVSFRYYVDGKLAMQSFGGGLDEAVAQVYGAKVLSQCYKIDAEKNGVTISGFIGNQNFFKPNKSYQSVFLNGRYIVNNTIATAINQAYASYMMKRQFPFYVLNICVPTDIVDVNVHPSKADVRFIDNKFIFGAIYSVISSVLDGTSKAAEFVVSETRLPEIQSKIGGKEGENRVYSAPASVSAPVANSSKPVPAPPSDPAKRDGDLARLLQKYDKSSAVAEDAKAVGINVSGGETSRNYYDPLKDMPLSELVPTQKPTTMRVTDEYVAPAFNGNVAVYEVERRLFEERKQEQQKIKFETCKYKGNLFNTYLIYEVADTVYMIDQHAAHERLIYDRLREKLAKRDVARQALLVPYIFTANPMEARFLEEKQSLLRAMGFGIAPFGFESFRIDEVPVDLQEINIKEFFDEILAEVDGLKDIRLEDVLKDKIAMTACKHAIKGGMQLTDGEVDALFKMLDGNMGLKCPHGRPVCVTLTKKDIEKMFKRIV
ncbi:MAG: DNA mismatch repair endonuclease MutL [Clostridia bacterium]|nr:DNA mismatch repair endonuclease MutL [Clostridia bacterium]